MKIIVTKKEFEAAKFLGFKMVKEFSKAEEITGVDEESVADYEKCLNESLKSEKGRWGKMTVRKDGSIGDNKIILEINEECISDIINEFYSPIVIATIKCIINVAKTFESVFKKCEKSFDKIYLNWFNIDFKTYVIENYVHEESPKGDFARDLKSDKKFPKTRYWVEVYNYLENECNCSQEVSQIFNDLWEEYRETI